MRSSRKFDRPAEAYSTPLEVFPAKKPIHDTCAGQGRHPASEIIHVREQYGNIFNSLFSIAYRKDVESDLGELSKDSVEAFDSKGLARHGIEPPTPAFSGLPSNAAKSSGIGGND